MQRIASAWVGVLAMGLVGCQKAESRIVPEQTMGIDYYTPGTSSFALVTETVSSFDGRLPVQAYPAEPATNEMPTLVGIPNSTRNHTVIKGDTLFKLARTYYNDASRWREIYQSNRDVLSDPHALRIGQQLTIP